MVALTLVDTDVLIAHLRGVVAARDWLLDARRRGPVLVSALGVAEVLGGMRSPERHDVRRLLATLRCEPVTRAVAEDAGELQRVYRRSHSGISLADYVVAATARAHELRPATLNVRHFPMFTDLEAPFSVT